MAFLTVFVAQLMIWMLYYFFWQEYIYTKKIRNIHIYGNLNQYVLHQLEIENLSHVKLIQSDQHIQSFSPIYNQIQYVQTSTTFYSVEELFAVFHEMEHAQQLKKRNFFYRMRLFWQVNIKKYILLYLYISVMLSIFSSLIFENHSLWVMASFFIGLHYLYCFFIVINEWDTNIKAYYKTISVTKLSKKERRYLLFHAFENTVDYMINIPIFLII